MARNRFVALLGVARDQAVARKALDLLLTDQITPPQKASLLRALAGSHPDLAFDWAVTRRETNSWRWPALMVAYLFALAYLFAGVTYWTARALGLTA